MNASLVTPCQSEAAHVIAKQPNQVHALPLRVNMAVESQHTGATSQRHDLDAAQITNRDGIRVRRGEAGGGIAQHLDTELVFPGVRLSGLP